MKKAFTLIELLIVVAIIAILAVIAVPNFLEAQVRSKVSRIKADMRSLSTAIESYAVDYNKYPLGWRSTGNNVVPEIDTRHERLLFGLSLLTTPVAYISTMPTDPFITQGEADGGGNANYPSRYESFGRNQWGLGANYGDDLTALGYTWLLWSVGPKRESQGANIQNVIKSKYDASIGKLYVYDATNGTNSVGYIMRTNKGLFPD